MRNWYEPVGKHAVRLKVWDEAFWNIVDPQPVYASPYDDPEYLEYLTEQSRAEQYAEDAWLRKAEMGTEDTWREEQEARYLDQLHWDMARHAERHNF